MLPAAKNNFLIDTFRFRVIQLTKLPRVFVERSEELQVSCDPAYNPLAGKGRAHILNKKFSVFIVLQGKKMVYLRLKTALICVQTAFFGR